MRQLIDTAAVFVTTDLKEQVTFYTEKLGFTCEVDWSTNPTFLICQRDGAAIMLKLAKTASSPMRHHTPGLDLMDAYIWVRDMDALVKDLNHNGAPVAEGPVKREYGCTELAVHDPDGRRIIFGFCP
ncbi:MAG: VOC family protein [Pseudomonadota bacterium]